MPKQQSAIRIKGLIRLTNYVRAQLNTGIPPENAAEFRQVVRDNIRAVDAICRKNHVTPHDLPAPSRRAYAYLRALDLNDLPAPTAESRASALKVTVRVTNVVSGCNAFSADLWDLACASAQWSFKDAKITDLIAAITADVDAIEALCAEQGGTPADLPVRSRRGYQWLAFLSDPRNLLQHLTTLATLKRLHDEAALRRNLPANMRVLSLHGELHNSSVLFRVRTISKVLHLVLHEGYVDAPPQILKSVLYAALAQRKPHLEKARAYADTAAFTDVVVALEASTAALSINTQGHFYDLAEVFDRVNGAYFEGALSPPRLCWNQMLTYRKMGHYDFIRDTVMLSQSLDAFNVPRHVIDFVMYHELLHKSLGVNRINGRRYAHTPEFRAAERTFAEYKSAQAFLDTLH